MNARRARSAPHVRHGSFATKLGCPDDVRFPPVGDQGADIAPRPKGTDIIRPARLVRSVPTSDIVCSTTYVAAHPLDRQK